MNALASAPQMFRDQNRRGLCRPAVDGFGPQRKIREPGMPAPQAY